MFLAKVFSSRDCNITSISTALVMLKQMIFGLVSQRKRKGKRYCVLVIYCTNSEVIQLTVRLFNTINHCSRPHRKQNVWLNGVKRSCLCSMIGGVRSTLPILYFCGQSVVTITMIDSSKTCNLLVGVEVQSLYVIVISSVQHISISENCVRYI